MGKFHKQIINTQSDKNEAIDSSLFHLNSAEIPVGRPNLSEAEKDELIRKVHGPKTTQNIIKALKDYSPKRIPFLFSSLDTQAVADILANSEGMEEALKRAAEIK